jgi:hypothetical protein
MKDDLSHQPLMSFEMAADGAVFDFGKNSRPVVTARGQPAPVVIESQRGDRVAVSGECLFNLLGLQRDEVDKHAVLTESHGRATDGDLLAVGCQCGRNQRSFVAGTVGHVDCLDRLAGR